MSSTYGENLKLSIFGQSHGPAIGMTLDGIPAGLPVDLENLQKFLNRRAPGQNDWSTPRREEDRPEFLAGILDGYTCGAPIAAVIHNKNTRSGDYENLKDCPRPGHADYTAQVKYGGFQDAAGGGHFSGRLTAPLCIAGGLCMQWLEEMGIQIHARISCLGGEADAEIDPVHPQVEKIASDFPVIDPEAGIRMRSAIEKAKKAKTVLVVLLSALLLAFLPGLANLYSAAWKARLPVLFMESPPSKAFSLVPVFPTHFTPAVI